MKEFKEKAFGKATTEMQMKDALRALDRDEESDENTGVVEKTMRKLEKLFKVQDRAMLEYKLKKKQKRI